MALITSPRFRKLALACLAGAVAATVPNVASAGTIFLGGGWRADWAPALDGFVTLQVDAVNANSIEIEKIIQFQSISTVDITFTQIAANAVEFIIINDEALTNQTGITWTDFHMQINDGGDAFFNPALTAASGGPAPIGFEIGPFTNANFGPGPSGPNTVLDIFGGGTIAPGATFFPGAGFGGPGADGGELYIQTIRGTGAPGDPFTVFNLKENPTIPEPASLGAVALASLATIRRRRRKA